MKEGRLGGHRQGLRATVQQTDRYWGLQFSRYTVTRPNTGFRHPDRMAPDQTVRGGEYFFPRPCWYFTFLPIPPWRKTFPDFFGNLAPCEKKTGYVSRKDRIYVLRSTDPVLYPWTTKNEILSHPLTFPAWRNVIPHW